MLCNPSETFAVAFGIVLEKDKINFQGLQIYACYAESFYLCGNLFLRIYFLSDYMSLLPVRGIVTNHFGTHSTVFLNILLSVFLVNRFHIKSPLFFICFLKFD